jgi:hypothetical protein
MDTTKLGVLARPNKTGGADGVKIAVLRKGRANLALISAAAHLNRYPKTDAY